jgi:hypothetical protein
MEREEREERREKRDERREKREERVVCVLMRPMEQVEAAHFRSYPVPWPGRILSRNIREEIQLYWKYMT